LDLGGLKLQLLNYPPDFRKKMLKDGKRGYGGAIELGNDFLGGLLCLVNNLL
jgi:hypothetical protein